MQHLFTSYSLYVSILIGKTAFFPREGAIEGLFLPMKSAVHLSQLLQCLRYIDPFTEYRFEQITCVFDTLNRRADGERAQL